MFSQGYLLICCRGRRQKYILFNGFYFKPCVFPSFLCHIFSTKSGLFSITECFDFCFSMPISLNFIIPRYIFTFFDWKADKSFSGQFSHPGMTVTLSTPPVSQRKKHKQRAAGKFITDLYVCSSQTHNRNSPNLPSSRYGDHGYQNVIFLFYFYFTFMFIIIKTFNPTKGIKCCL